MKKWMQYIKKERGFTLIEILVVIGIMAVLAAVIIPRIMDTSDGAKVQADLANKKMLQSAIERYYFDTGKYPVDATGDDLDNGTGTIKMTLLTGGKYIDEAPEDPWSTTDAPGAYQLTDGVVETLNPND